ncbi:MAG: FAD-dependent oxidoreductase [Deltaproteobacteria bacterium]|nr:FAD-dependent oxidoreductase [Deltaproteobacteria bacterium]
MHQSQSQPPIAILGAGPIGLEAALAAAQTGRDFVLYEAQDQIGASVRDWGHVHLFSPWSLNVSPRVRGALEAAGHSVPSGEDCPTGRELLEQVLEPLARLPKLAAGLRLDTRVLGIGRKGLIKNQEIGTAERAARPFRILLGNSNGEEWVEEASAVLDCTGSYHRPNTLGDGGIPAPGETALGDRIVRRVPNFHQEKSLWAGKTTLLVGAGHSAQTAARDLAELASSEPGTKVIWALRRQQPGFGPLEDDPLPQRASLQAAARHLVEGAKDQVEVRLGMVVERLGTQPDDRIEVCLRGPEGEQETVTVDRILALTGSVGDYELYRQLQVHECYATSGPMKLAAVLLGEVGGDCLTQSSHGADTLKNPEPDFFILGSKSYGRNNTFLLRVGWQQVDEVMELLGR